MATTQAEQLEELAEQLAQHGYKKVDLRFDDGIEQFPVYIRDVRFEDDRILVELEY